MSRQPFDRPAEARLLARYLAAVDPRRATWQRPPLGQTCRQVRAMTGGQVSVLDYAHTAAWIRDWCSGPAAHLQAGTQGDRLCALRSWWSWLFGQHELDYNVLAYFSPISDVLRTLDASLVLTWNLQRPIA
jgi:hypothetical protein